MANILSRLSSIVQDIRSGKQVDIADIEELLNHFCEKPIVEEECTYHPFTDPRVSHVLNLEYFRAKGYDHPNYIKYQLGIIKGLLDKEKELLEAKAYKPEFFLLLKGMKTRIENEGLMKGDKFGNAVPVNIAELSQEAIEYVATLGDNGAGDHIRPCSER